MSDTLHQHAGACECGAVQFVYRCGQSLAEITARACQCIYCLPHQASYVSDPQAQLHITLKDKRYLYAHRFGTGTADFMHCVICNSQVFVRSEIDGHLFALVSARALLEFDQLQEFSAVDFDSETLEERLSRRSEPWIPELYVYAGNAR